MPRRTQRFYFARPSSAIRISIVRASISRKVRYAVARARAALPNSSLKIRVPFRMKRESSQVNGGGSSIFSARVAYESTFGERDHETQGRMRFRESADLIIHETGGLSRGNHFHFTDMRSARGINDPDHTVSANLFRKRLDGFALIHARFTYILRRFATGGRTRRRHSGNRSR